MVLMFLQVFYFFKVLNFLSKYVQLIFKGLKDSAGFLVLFVLFEIFFAVGFHVLGAGIEIGDELEAEEFDNDYPFMDYWIVCWLTDFRSGVGDLQSPAY